MADQSTIEWTEATWNVATGCTRVSAGCDHCYIERTIPFRIAGRRFDQAGVGGTTGVLLHPERLNKPLHWRQPRRMFVNSLADLFHDAIPDGFIADVFAVMARTQQHTYQLLTKRHARMRSLLSSETFRDAVTSRLQVGEPGFLTELLAWPLPNVWLGVSVETQQWADTRIPALLDTPAAIRWISAEPLLGPVRLADGWLTQLRAVRPGLDWVVVGGESGPGARPMHPDWARDLRDQCTAAGVPYFFKQWGEWRPLLAGEPPYEVGRTACLSDDGTVEPWTATSGPEWCYPNESDGTVMRRTGKHTAGRGLDGRTWDEYPHLVTAGCPWCRGEAPDAGLDPCTCIVRCQSAWCPITHTQGDQPGPSRGGQPGQQAPETA